MFDWYYHCNSTQVSPAYCNFLSAPLPVYQSTFIPIFNDLFVLIFGIDVRKVWYIDVMLNFNFINFQIIPVTLVIQSGKCTEHRIYRYSL